MKREVDHGPYWITLYLEAIISFPRLLLAFFPAMLLGVVAAVPLFLLSVIGVVDRSFGGAFLDLVFDLIILFTILLAVAPVVASVLTLYFVPGGYGLTRWELDAEEPSARQHDLLVDSQRRVTANAPAGAIGPSKWLVLDKNDPNAFVIGTTIYVHRGLITSEYLDPVIAHELGHLNHGDGRLMLALRRLVPPPLSYIEFEEMGCLPLTVMGFNGGLGLLVTSWLWNRHWQRRELLADRFAFECGQATGLIEILDLYGFFDVAVPFGALRRDHPHNEQRVDELMRLLKEESLPAAPTVPTLQRAVPRQVPPPPEPFIDRLTPEQEKQSRERKGGFTDAESVLDLVFLDEDHVGSGGHEQIAAEKDWIRANGRRIVDLAHFGTSTSGPCAIWIFWIPRRKEQYGNDAFHYITREAHSELMDDAESRIAGPTPQAVAAKWRQLVATHDSDREVVVVILSLQGPSGQFNLHQYLAGMRGGGPLPAWGEEPPSRG